MSEGSDWQVRRAKGRRIYTGLSRAQVERALRSGKLATEDLALPPGETRWLKVPVALVHTGEDAAAGISPAGLAPGTDVPPKTASAEWAPMQQEGRIIRPERETEDPADMDMTPMIDVTTLLLIFFLVGGVFMLQANIELPQSKTGTPEIPAERKPIGVFIEIAENDPAGGRIAFEDARKDVVALDDLKAGYEKRVNDGSLPEAMIKAHRGVPFGVVRQAMAKFTEAGAAQIKIGVEEAK